MQYITFHHDPEFKIAILAYDLNHDEMKKSYFDNGLIHVGADPEIIKEAIAYKLPYTMSKNGKKRKPLSVDEQRSFFRELLSILKDIGIMHVLVSQPDYFKTLTGSPKASEEVGTLFTPSTSHFPDHQDISVLYVPNYKMSFYDPVKTEQGIQIAMQSLLADRNQVYVDPGKNITKFCYYPQTYQEIRNALSSISEIQNLTCDIETFSLDMHDAGIASIAFAWNENEGIAFQVDHAPGFYNYEVREQLIFWLTNRSINSNSTQPKLRLIFHNAAFDLTVLVHQLASVSESIDSSRDIIFNDIVVNSCFEDTKIISYLATNSCAGNKLGLKQQAVEFAGNYAVDEIKDVTKIPVAELLEYNLIDCFSTWFVYNKNYPLMVEENQEEIYRQIFLPSLIDIVDMQLNGLPVDMNQVAISKADLTHIKETAVQTILNNTIVKDYTYYLKEKKVEELHSKWKKKRTDVSQIELEFNPDSDLQLSGLLYSPVFLGLPILGETASGAPSTKSKYIKDLRNHTKNPDVLSLLNALLDFKDSSILLSTFIPALEGARKAPDGNYYMHGNFNIGGTVSGRLSSSDPNLQNTPSKSRLAKYIKRCIKALEGWLFVGLDFDSLEDKISALLTKDPNKLKVYTDGYDGHCLRAYSYFGDQMPDIDSSSVASINSIESKYPELRQMSKAPTFLLTYGGTRHGLMNNCGFDAIMADQIETNYHELYKVSDAFIEAKINEAADTGYVTAAFGLRVRTPILNQVVMTKRHTPHQAKAEARTAGNALGQSWGLLNNRAASEFMERVRGGDLQSEIRISCQIHDAQYYLVRDNASVLNWFNQNIVECVQWQKHPDIKHPDVKLSGAVSVFYPTWAEEHKLQNDASYDDVYAFLNSLKVNP